MKKRKLRLKTWVVLIIFIISFIFFVISGYKVILWKINLKANHEIQNTINDKVRLISNNGTEEYSIDFEYLKSINSDTIAYLKVPGTNIEYIVVKGKDNKYYLKHNYNKEYNIAGWIFADYHNRFDEYDKNLIIYGHNTKDGSMFGSLLDVIDKKWQENKDNHMITLVTEKDTYKYKVFSTYSIVPEDYYINTIFETDDEYEEFVNTLKNRSNYKYDTNVDKNSKILTLSSCIGDGRKRVVLHAVLINDKLD